MPGHHVQSIGSRFIVRRSAGLLLRATTLCALAATAGGCWLGDTPSPELPVLDLGTGGGNCAEETCDCLGPDAGVGAVTKQTGLDGRAFRFTKMVVEEPYALADLLNKKWSDDLRDDILNVLFSFKTSDPSKTGYVAREAVIRAGSGWHTPFDIHLPEGVEVDEYCVLGDTVSDITLQPDRSCTSRCQLATVGNSSLNFFAGPAEQPMNCAPELPLPHAIPLTQVKAHFTFSADCTQLLHGTLTACLERPATEKLCICATASGTCTVEEPIQLDPPAPNPTAYCQRCGPGSWISMSEFLDMIGPRDDPETAKKLPPCDEPIGANGYKVTGVFEAVQVTDQGSTTGLADCPVEN